LKTSSFEPYSGPVLTVLGWTVLLSCLLFKPAFAQNEQPPKAGQDEKSKIHITADSLTADNEAKFAEFKGNVKATQGTSVIKADSLKIVYRATDSAKKTGEAAASSIEKIIASGNVLITIDDKVAVTQKAVYTMKDRILKLSGSNSKITSGKDSIIGEAITFYRTDGRIKVEGGSDRRVEATFYSDGEGIR
jgi:lipopolysaccharide export system protein LptA